MSLHKIESIHAVIAELFRLGIFTDCIIHTSHHMHTIRSLNPYVKHQKNKKTSKQTFIPSIYLFKY